MRTLIKLLLILCIANSQATTITYGSYPDSDSNFYFSDGRGNSIAVGTTQNIPYIYNNYPSAIWVDGATDRLPANMVVYQYINGYPSYLCRVSQDGRWMYGQLIINEGCVLNDDDNTTFKSFQVLIR